MVCVSDMPLPEIGKGMRCATCGHRGENSRVVAVRRSHAAIFDAVSKQSFALLLDDLLRFANSVGFGIHS